MKGTLNEKKRLKKEEKKTSPPKATATAKSTTTKKNIVLPAPAAAVVSRKTRSSFSAATNVKTPATSTTSIHNAKDSGSKRKKASKDNAEKHADPVFGSYDENLLNKMWDEGLGCREHINEYDDFPQHSTGLNTVIIYTYSS
jgi:hypothetical protein